MHLFLLTKFPAHSVLSPHIMKNTSVPLCDACCQQLSQLLGVQSSETNTCVLDQRMNFTYVYIQQLCIISPKADLLIIILSSNMASVELDWSAVCACHQLLPVISGRQGFLCGPFSRFSYLQGISTLMSTRLYRLKNK